MHDSIARHFDTMPTTAPPSKVSNARMTWADVCALPGLNDLPYKIEQDRHGRIVMSPAPLKHSVLQRRFIQILEDALGGAAFPEFAVETPEGVKVPDVAWMEVAVMEAHIDADASPVAPPICVEVMSKWNTSAEMAQKVMLYLAKGAQEVWILERDGRLRFFGHEGERERSTLVPDAPPRVEAKPTGR